MACKAEMIYKIMAKFTGKTLPIIRVDPNYEDIIEIMQVLYVNLVGLPTLQGGGHNRHIGIIMNPTLYSTLKTTECIKLTDPVVYPTVP